MDRRAGSFSWPPKPPAPEPGPPPRVAPPESSHDHGTVGRAVVHSRLREIERTWLGLTTPPLAERMEAAGWTPDAPWAYCPRCGSTVGPHEADDTGCPKCRSRRLPWERLVRLGEYTGLLRDVVQEVKFTRWRRLGDELGRLLGRSVNRAIEDAGVDRERCVLVPVPCSFRRRMVRGIDHALVVARGLAAETGLPVVMALARRHRPSQLSVPASQRAANVAGSMRARRGADLTGMHVIVLDDVTTTRATLIAACRAVLSCRRLVSGGDPERIFGIWAAVAAVTPETGGRGRTTG